MDSKFYRRNSTPNSHVGTLNRRRGSESETTTTGSSKNKLSQKRRGSVHFEINEKSRLNRDVSFTGLRKKHSSGDNPVSPQRSFSGHDLEKLILNARVIQEARSETEVQSEKEWMESEKVWLVHKGGFASACVLKGNGMSVLPEGRVKIKLDHGGDTLEVDEDDVEKANPPQYDRAEDIASLRFLNESSALHILRQRYGANLVHTYCGPSVAVVNPMHPISIYSEKVMQVFKGCKQEDMPPHIYAMGQMTYREMLQSRSDQSIVFMGRSGSGKSSNSRHVMQYLITSAGSVGNIFSVEKLTAVNTLMEAFGNSRTILNTNGSR